MDPATATPQDLTQLAALAAALGWASGMRLYAAVFLTGLAGWLQWVTLPAGLQVLENPLVLGAAGVMLVVEFIADKVPAVDSLWDAVHTAIRIPAGAALAVAALSGSFGGDALAWGTVTALLGGTLAATAHAGKASTRAAVNTLPEPFTNLALSLVGDAAVPGLLWLSWTHPIAFFAVLIVAVALALALSFTLWRFVRRRLARLAR
ncbi:DUF4126 domain-containing protein [Azohydromonas australica]|uniref:DUF4126 domain-containing protein n=1 Tax=Azohydromonas australica TaxID=364039 RepID=UPI0003F61766|nr:DUF4126 domain-containing protein [Azohydromonas australica]